MRSVWIYHSTFSFFPFFLFLVSLSPKSFFIFRRFFSLSHFTNIRINWNNMFLCDLLRSIFMNWNIIFAKSKQNSKIIKNHMIIRRKKKRQMREKKTKNRSQRWCQPIFCFVCLSVCWRTEWFDEHEFALVIITYMRTIFFFF